MACETVLTYNPMRGASIPDGIGFTLPEKPRATVLSIRGNELSWDRLLEILTKRCVTEKDDKVSHSVVEVPISILETTEDGVITKFQLLGHATKCSHPL